MTVLIRAAGLAGYEALCRTLGIDAARELRRVGLRRKDLADPDALVPFAAVLRLLENSALAGDCPDFGLRLSQLQDIDIFGPLAVLMRHAPTVGAALQFAGRYMFMHSPAIRTGAQQAQDSPGHIDLTYEIDMVDRPACAQTVELALSLMLRVLRLLSQAQIEPPVVRLPHKRMGSSANYTRILGCTCQFERPIAAVRVAAADLWRPLPQSNPLLQQMARSYLDREFVRPGRLLSDRVRIMVRRMMGASPITQVVVAEALSLHPRTLQRRLLEEGVRFESIVDEQRSQVLASLLTHQDPPSMTRIAQMLGYAEQAVLTRSCRRWYGCTPRELHARLVAKASRLR